MGTRCLTVFQDNDGTEIAVLYRQFDGYPDGMGNDLKEFLAPKRLVNGMSGDTSKVANGMGCLAAQIVAHFKTEAGNFYLYPAGARDCGEEFIYTLYPAVGVIHMRVQAGSVTFFGMPGTKQGNMGILYDGPASAFDSDRADKVRKEIRDEIPNDFIEGQK